MATNRSFCKTSFSVGREGLETWQVNAHAFFKATLGKLVVVWAETSPKFSTSAGNNFWEFSGIL